MMTAAQLRPPQPSRKMIGRTLPIWLLATAVAMASCQNHSLGMGEPPAGVLEQCLRGRDSAAAAAAAAAARPSLARSDDDLDYMVFSNNSFKAINGSVRDCLCKGRDCISVCSNAIFDVYDSLLRQNASEEPANLFHINLTLANGTLVQRHILHDLLPVVYRRFCTNNYSLKAGHEPMDAWQLFQNGTLLRLHDRQYLRGNSYCFDLDEDDDVVINPYNCAVTNQMSTMEVVNCCAMLMSILLLLPVLMCYCFCPKLRSLYGKCFISYVSSITCSYSVLSFINLSGLKFDLLPCILMGFCNHFFQLAHYCWLGIISYDVYRLHQDINYVAHYEDYACFGWLMPLLGTILTFLAQASPLPEYLKPGINSEHCGLEVNRWAASIYLYGPSLAVMVFCLFAFIGTSRTLNEQEKLAEPLRAHKRAQHMRYTMYLRLFLVMGLSWFTDLASYVMSMFELKVWTDVLDFFNAVQGLNICFNFIARPSVRHVIRERFNHMDPNDVSIS